MKQNIVYVGLDVYDTQYHGSALDKNTGEVIHFKCRPTLKGLLGQLEKLVVHAVNSVTHSLLVQRQPKYDWQASSI